MPARIVVVKRPRDGLFAALRRVAPWLRAVWQSEEVTARSPVASGVSASDDRAPAFAPSMTPAFRRPRWRSADAASERCGDCEVCIRLCPARALAREPDAAGGAGRANLLDLGRCIGCGLCAESCPAAALELVEAAPVAWAPVAGEPLRVRLGERSVG